MKDILKIIICSALTLSFPGLIKAQDNNGLSGTIVVGSDIKPKLADAVKIDVLPVQNENISIKKPAMSYTTDPYLIPSPAYKTKLPAVSIKNIPLPELQRGFVKGAFGNYSNLYGEIFYNTIRNRTDLVSVDAKHVSGDANSSTVKNSGFSTNSIDLFASHIFAAKYSLSGSIGDRRDANHFYATIPDSLKPTSTGDYQAFNDFHARLNFENTGADSGKLRYNLGVGYNSFTDYYKTAESDVTLTEKADEPLNSNHIVENGSYDNMSYKTMENNITRSILKINLGYDFKTGIFRAHLGFKTASETDSNHSFFHFYPDIKFETDLIEKYLTVLGGITGNLENNTFRSLAYENPFIVSDPMLKNINDKFDLFGGIKGSFSSNSSFLLTVAYRNYSNLNFFLQDTTDRRKFAVVYDNSTTDLNVHGELAWSFMENLDLSTKLDLNSYSVSNIQKPFERPGFQWMLTGNYNIEHKIVFGGDLFYVGSRYATDLSEKTITTLKPYVDMNAHVSYAFDNIKGLKVFIELNNIFGYQYMIWNNYPVRGFQILGGASFSFL